jgi:hypothetical protein
MSGIVLPDLPASFEQTRDHLHQLAFFAVSPARHKAVGRMGLRHHDGGFGTSEFDGKIVRVEGNLLVLAEADSVATQTISTIRHAVEFLGHGYEANWFEDFHDPLSPLDPDQRLDIDPAATAALGEWFAFGWAILDELREHADPGDDPSEVQLWPEHFDAATELGDHGKGQRASYGASPGDTSHSDPYVYVSAWSEIDRANPYWNDDSFNGSSLSYAALTGSDDPSRAALDFYLEGHRILHG